MGTDFGLDIIREIRKSAAWSGGIELIVNLHMVQCDVPVFEPTDDPGAFCCVSHFECPVVVKTKKLVYRGRSHKTFSNRSRAPNGERLPRNSGRDLCTGKVVSIA